MRCISGLSDHLREVSIEKRHDERGNVLSVDIGIGHDHNFVVAQFVDIGLFRVHFSVLAFFLHPETDAQRLDNVVHLVAFESFVPHGFLHIEDLTAQRQDGLCGTTATLLGRTAGRVTLDEEKFALFGNAARTVRQVSGKSPPAIGFLR